jgi:cytosine/adenosine deaminase-related metal-dependent hydrolase
LLNGSYFSHLAFYFSQFSVFSFQFSLVSLVSRFAEKRPLLLIFNSMKIISARWVLPVAAGPIEGGAVAIDGERIAAVGRFDEIAARFPNAYREDFGEAAVLPGLVNAHSHLEITAMRGFLDDVEHDFFAWLMKLTKGRAEHLTEQDIETAALFGALEAARAGVTCLGDIGRMGSAGFKALKASGLRGIVFQETEFSPDDKTAAEDFEKLKEKFLELKAGETRLVKAGLSPHAPYTVSALLFRKIADYAIEENVKISVHAAESREEQALLETGEGFFADVYKKYGFEWLSPNCSPVEYLDRIGVLRARPLLAHCINVSERDIELIEKSGSGIAHCPKSNAKFGHGAAPLEKFLDAGIAVGFGSDSVASNNACDILEEARFAALLARTRPDKKRFLTAREMIETATLGGARALGLADETGSLAPGKQADIAVISLSGAAQMPVFDPHTALVFASGARDVLLTMVAGREIFKNGKTILIDEDALKREMRSIGRKLVS